MATNILSLRAINLLAELKTFIENINGQVYAAPSHYIDNASIGMHTRHVIEFFDEMLEGYDSGMISYDKRKRDIVIESDKEFAIRKINLLTEKLNRADKNLTLEQAIFSTETIPYRVATSYERELIYNIEHTVHHMALIKVAAKEKGVAYKLSPDFGYADSTIINKMAEAEKI